MQTNAMSKPMPCFACGSEQHTRAFCPTGQCYNCSGTHAGGILCCPTYVYEKVWIHRYGCRLQVLGSFFDAQDNARNQRISAREERRSKAALLAVKPAGVKKAVAVRALVKQEGDI